MKITKIVLMLIVGTFLSVGVFAFEAPAVDKITDNQSIYVSVNKTAGLELDFRMCGWDTFELKHTETISTADALSMRPTNDGGKVEVGWRILLTNYEMT